MDQSAIFKSIADSFNKTPQEVRESLLKIGLVLIFFSLIPLLKILLRRRARRKLWSYEYETQIRKFDLTINELDMINELSAYLVNPKRKLLLLNNRSSFTNALLLWEKKHGKRSVYINSLLKKLFKDTAPSVPGEFAKPFGAGKPVRLITPDKKVFSGLLAKQDKDQITLEKVEPVENIIGTTPGQLYVQDSSGIRLHPVDNVKRISPDSLQLNLSPSAPYDSRKSTTDILLYTSDSEAPVKTRLQPLKGRLGIINNPGGNLVVGQAVKISLRGETEKIHHVNGIVKALSHNKRYAKIAFGYVKKKE